MKDPIVDELRQRRLAHTERFHGDLRLICEDLRKFETDFSGQVIEPQPKLLQPQNETTKST